MIHVAIRFDDPSRNSSHIVERGLIALLRKHRTPATFAVIPYSPISNKFVPLTADAIPHLISAADDNVIEIAQHGYRHQRQGCDTGEFSGRELHEQFNMMHDGKKLLEELFKRSLAGFVPPFNDCDLNTVIASKELGFNYLSAGWHNHKSNSVIMLPRTCNIFEVVEKVESLRKAKLDGVVIGVMHHYDFKEDEGSKSTRVVADFGVLLGWLNEQNDIKVSTLARLANELSFEKWQSAHRIYQFIQKIPWRFKQKLPNGCLLISPSWRVTLSGLIG